MGIPDRELLRFAWEYDLGMEIRLAHVESDWWPRSDGSLFRRVVIWITYDRPPIVLDFEEEEICRKGGLAVVVKRGEREIAKALGTDQTIIEV